MTTIRELYEKGEISRSSYLAHQARLEQLQHGKVITPCPKCHTLPVITTSSGGERTVVSCECRYVFTAEINF